MQQIYLESYFKRSYTRFMNYVSNVNYLPKEEQQKIIEKVRILNFFDEFGIKATTSAFGTSKSSIYLWKQKLHKKL